MATILAIDTSTSACSVALSLQGSIQEDFRLSPQSHTQCLLPMIDQLLASHQISLTAVDAIALTTGPGSFTGLRIGLGIVQGLAFGADLPVIGESSLHVMSLSANRLLRPTAQTYLLPSFDARMQEVYWACYRCGTSATEAEFIVEDTVAAPKSMLEYARTLSAPLLAVGDGWTCLSGNGIDENGDIESSLNCLQVVADFYPHAYDVAALSQVAYQHGRMKSPAEVEPVYIRNEVSWKKRQKIRSQLSHP